MLSPVRSPSKSKKGVLAKGMQEDAAGNKLPLRMTDVEGYVKGAEQAWAAPSGGGGGSGSSGNSGGAKRSQAPGGDGTNKRRRGA